MEFSPPLPGNAVRFGVGWIELQSFVWFSRQIWVNWLSHRQTFALWLWMRIRGLKLTADSLFPCLDGVCCQLVDIIGVSVKS